MDARLTLTMDFDRLMTWGGERLLWAFLSQMAQSLGGTITKAQVEHPAKAGEGGYGSVTDLLKLT
jgi:hypothetical protein